MRNRGNQIDAAVDAAVNGNYNASTSAVQRFGDPLTLDLNGNGIETVPLSRPPLFFDLNADGIKTSTGWIAPSDGLLAMDRNGDGLINDGAELFGDATPSYSTAGVTADGFAALAQEDTNHDGVVNNLDANWANLRVWQDLNQDGISQSDELSTLDAAGIASFNTARTLNSQMLPSGNQMADLGTFTRTDGTTGATGAPQAMADINLALDTFHRTFADAIPTTAQTDALPDMQGSGLVRDMRQAASLQTAAGQTFATALANFSAAGTREEQLAQIDTLLANWADTAEFGTQQSRAAAHGYTYTTNLGAEWQRKLTTLEVFNGRGFFKMPWDGASIVQTGLQGLRIGGYAGGVWNPKLISGTFWGAQLAPLDQAYAALRESVYQALLPQTRLKPYLDSIGLTLDASGTFQLDFSAVQTAFANTLTSNPAKVLGDLLEFNRYGKTMFAGTVWEVQGWEALGAMLNNVAITPAIQKTLSDFNVGMDGHPELAVATGKAQILVADAAGSALTGGYSNDILVGGNGADTLNGGYGNDLLLGGSGSDTLDGGRGNDTLKGGAGSDTLSGGDGNDTYLYNRGDGADNIVDSNYGYSGYGYVNTLQFGAGIALADIAVKYDSASGKVVLDLGSGDSIDIGHPYLHGFQNGLGIQQFRFADGSMVSTDTLLRQNGMMQNGTDGADVLQGSDSRDYGDALNGGAGDDTLDGDGGNDILNGGIGNDVLNGGQGNDTYVYNLGDGADTIVDSTNASGYYYRESNTLQFGAGIMPGMLSPRFDSTLQTVILDLGNGDSIDIGTIGAFSVQTLKFADGSSVAVDTLVADQSLTQTGTEGADTLVGANTYLYRDVLKGLGGNDVLQGLGGNDELDGGAGDDVLDGGSGHDVLIGGDGADTLDGRDGNDTLQGGAGSDVLAGGTGSDTYVYNRGDGADTVTDSGQPYTNWWGVTRDTANNVLSFGAGIDASMITPRFDSASGSLLLDLGGGDSVNAGVLGELSIQTLQFADGTEIPVGTFLNQHGLTVEGTSGADVLRGSTSGYVDHLAGGAGDDTLLAGGGDDILVGGTGNDVLDGGNGWDTYVFNLGDGADTIQDVSGEYNALSLGAGIAVGMIAPRLDGATGEVRLDFGGGDSIAVGQYDAAKSALRLSVGRLDFADGTSVYLEPLLNEKGFLVEGQLADEILAGAMSQQNRMYGFDGNDTLQGGQRDDTLDGGTGNDMLDANYGDDVLTGGTGDDFLFGGEGSDVYVYNLGDGTDVVFDAMREAQVNTIRLGGGADVQSIEYRGGATGDLVLHFADGGSLRIAGITADNAAVTCPVQRFELADGSVLTAQQLLSQFSVDVIGADAPWWDWWTNANDTLYGTNLNDNMQGLSGDDVLVGGGGNDLENGGTGNDTLSGDAGDDTLQGGDGNDVLYGREGNDVLQGDMGDDILLGGTGNDTYLFSVGAGMDRIADNAGTDVLRFGPGIAQADLSFGKAGVGLRIALPNGMDAVVLENWFAGGSTVNSLQFDDGTTFDLSGIAQSVADQPVVGTAANETLVGSIYNDTLGGGQGNDILIGGTGEDVYRFNAGDGVDQIYELSSMAAVKGGDTLEFGSGITAQMLNLSLRVISQDRNWNPPVFPDPNADMMFGDRQRQVMDIRIGSQGDAIQVMSGKGAIEKFRFADGSEYSWQELFALQGGGSVSDSNDSAWTYDYTIWNGSAWVLQSQTYGPHRVLDGTGLAATFDGGVGDDTMLGGMQNDTYVFNAGDGKDVIADFGGVDEIAFGPGITAQDLVWQYDPAAATPFVLNVGANGDSISILDGEMGVIERFSFSDGAVLTFADLLARQGGLVLQAPSDVGGDFAGWNSNLIVGTNGADTISDGGDANFIVGGGGDDVINLGSNSDTVLFRQGDGQDTVNVDSYADASTLVFGPDVDPASVKIELLRSLDPAGAEVHDMRIAYGNWGDSVTVLGAMPGNYASESPSDAPRIRIEFADGTAWSYADLLARAQNTIVADPNNSVLLGTPGNDTFSISDLSSEHTIIDAAGPGNSNSVELGWAYSATQLDVVTYEDAPFSMVASENSKAPFTLSMVGGSLSVQFDNGVILNIDGFDPADPQGTCAIRNFKFSDGTVLGIDQVLSAGIDIMGTESTDIVHGTAVSDRIEGLSGDDTIMGGKGNDVLRGGTGIDTYVFNRGDGADTIEDVSFYWDRQQLVMENNVLRLGAGIDVAAVAVKFDPAIGKVYLDAGSGDSVCIGEPGNFSVQSVQFADGTVWDEWTINDRMTVGAILKPDSGMTYSATLADGSALPGWLSFDPSTGTFSGTPANDDVGSISVTVTATGSMGQPLSSTFLLEVLNVNDAPVVVASLDNQTAMEGNAFRFALPGQPATSPFPGDATDAGTPDRVWTIYDKWMSGSGVDDIYTFARGDGNVYIDDWDNSPFDVVQLAADIAPSDITVTQDDSSLVLSINGTGDSLTLGSWLWSDSWKVEQVVFADGTVWGVNDLMAMAPLTPSTANDWLTGTAGNDTIHGLAGDDYVQSAEGNDTVIGGAGHDSLRAGIGDDTVHAGSGNDWIEGDGGSDILLGGDGMDDIYADSNYSDTANDLLDGGAGDDYLESSIANDLIIGGQGNDFLSADDGNDVILFNRGDGVDTLNSYSTNEGPVGQRADTISLGGGIEYADLSFSRDRNNLILNTGNGESITFRNWFDTLWLDNKNISTLQMMAEGMVGYDSASTDPLLNKRIQQFDFVGLANQFEAELAIDQTITTWQLAPHLGSFYLGGSDVAAIGGDMAYLYGKSGNLDGLTEAEVRTQLSDSAAFGTASQALTKLSMGAGSIVFGDEDIIHGDRLTFSATLSDGSPLPAWLTFEATTGTFSGTPGSGDAGILNVAVTATDTGGLSATTNFVLTVTSNGQLNVAPLASADTASVSEDTAQATIAAADLLANDTDPDVGDMLTLTGFDAVSALGNTVSQDAAGDLVLDIGDLYQSLGAGQTASDSFTYTASDAAGLTSTASVDVTIIGVNDAPVVAIPIAGQQSNEDSPFSFTVPTGTFTDIDNGDVLTYSATLADGTALPNWLSFDAATGTFSGTPDNLNVGNLNVLVTATDTGGLSASSAFSLHVANVNDTSTANADTGAATEDGGAVLLDAAILLSNDTDPDFIHGDVLSIVGVSQAASGAAVSLMNGAVQYDAGALFQSLGQGQTATDTFSYTVSDMAGATSTATVTMTITGVNDGPVTANDAAAVLEDAALVATGNVLANDTDVDQGTVLSVTNAGMLQGSYGSLVLNADGSYLYTLDNASAAVQGLMAGQSVTETFAYQATDGIAITPATLTVSINGANDAPVVASLITGQQTNEDAPFSFTVPVVTFTDIDNGDVLTYSATLSDGSVLPGWLTFDAATQTFSGTPGNWDVGNYSVTVTATDTGGLSASSTFAVDVANVNDVPTMNMALLDQGTLQDAAFSFTVPAGTFNDVDFIHRDVLTYSATMADGTALPSWLTFDAATQTFSGTPGNWDVGNYSVTVTATDTGGLSASSTFAFDVANVNDAPTVSMALLDQGALQDAAFNFTVPMGAFNDADFIHGDTLIYSATMADGTALPSWLIFDAATQTFGGTPGNWDVGSYSVTVTATDTGGLSASSTFAIDVANVNDAPTVSMTLADQATLQDAAFSFTVPAGTFNDVDFIHGDTLSYSATLADGTALPSWLTFDATTQTFSGTPGNGDVGSLSVVIMATDTGGLGASSAFNLNVANVNDAPTVSVALLDQGTLQDTAFSFTVPAGTFNDVDFIHGDTLSYSATLSDGTALPSWLSFDAATGTFSGTPANGDVGNLNVLVTATDMGGLSASSAFNLNVVNVNDTPTANADTGAAIEDGGAVLLDAATLLANDTDPDFIHGDVLNIVGVSQAASGAAVSLLNGSVQYDTGTLFQSLGQGQTVTDTFSYTVSDTAGATSTATVTMTVTGVNDGPIAQDDFTTLSQNAQQPASGNLLTNDSDVDQGTVLSVANAGVIAGSYGSLTLSADGSYSYVLDNTLVQSLGAGQHVTETFAYQATDGIAITPATLTVTISGANDAPVVASPLSDLQTNEDAPFSFNIPTGTFTDIDNGDVLTYSATLADGTALPSWLSFDAATQTFSGTPGNWDVGNYSVTVIATDTGGLSASSTFAVDVANVNDAPTVSMALLDQGTLQDAAFSFTVPADTFNDVDFIHGDTLSYSATLADGTALPSWLTFDAATATFSGTPANGDVGKLNVLLTATDTGGLSASSAFNLNVVNVNDTPTANADTGAAVEDGGAVLLDAPTLLANDTDPDFIHGDALNIVGVSQAASGAAVSLVNGAVQYDVGTLFQSLAQGQTATDTFSYTVSDMAGATSTATVTMTITGVNDGPVTANDAAAVQEDAALVATGNVLANDTDVDQGTVLSVANAGTLQGIYGSLVLNVDGSYAYTLDNTSVAVQGLMAGQGVTEIFAYQATDGIATTPATLTVTIAGTNDAPVAQSDTATVDENSLLTIQSAALLANDTDADIGDTKTVISVDGTSVLGATLALANGQVVYDHGGRFNSLMAGQSVTDSFSYTMTDSAGATSTATVSVTVTGVNDGPQANGDNAITNEDTPQITLAAASLLANDTDPDAGDALSISGFDGVTTLGNAVSMDAAGNLVFDIGNRYQSLAAGQTVTDAFSYTITDIAGATNTAQVSVTITGVNDGPVVAADTAAVQEDLSLAATGNVLANDSDIDQGTVLSVADAGIRAGSYGNLALASDGSYTYSLDNTSAAVQSLGRTAQVAERFGYTATDGIAGTASVLDVFLSGANDAPILVSPLADQYLASDKHFSWQMPAGSFTDIDQGDVLDYTATMADGSALPEWLKFDAATQTFSGEAPKERSALDVRVTATDKVAATGSTVGSLSASDVFHIAVSRGNEGFGNGQDAPPPGHDRNRNDGVGSSPGHPGSRGGKNHSMDSGWNAQGNESDDRSSDNKADKRDAHAKDHEDNDSRRTDELIQAWFDKESASEQFSSFSSLSRKGGRGSQTEWQVNRNVAKGVAGDVSSEWERMNARLRQHLERGGGDEGSFADSGAGSGSFRLYGMNGQPSIAQLGMGNSEQMKGFAGLREGLERLAG